MIDTKSLREKVLDLAIRGQLVPQDPNDEPASALLERIRNKKQQLVKEGKLNAKDVKNDTIIFKGDDNLHYEKFQDGTVKCIEAEIPFELSNGWHWERLGNLSSVIQYGLSDSAKTSGTHRLLRITDIQNGKVNWEKVPFTTIEDEDSYLLEKGDIVFARTGATVGKSYLINDLPYPSVYASYLIRIRLLNGLSPEYLSLFFNSKCYWNQIIDKSVGSGQPNCNGTSLKNLLIPVPPIEEQLLIIEECKSLIKCVSEIDEKKEELRSSVNLIKSKILNLAIRGQLVPQNPNDEPASVLLERIHSEKEELIKQGKIKRDKKESIIFRGDDNSYYETNLSNTVCINDKIPFEIPSNWRWCNLSMIGTTNIGLTYNPTDITIDKNGTIVLRSCNIVDKKMDYSDIVRVKKNIRDNQYVEINDILICARNGSKALVGKCALINNYEDKMSFGAFMAVFRTSFYQYAFLYFNTQCFRRNFENDDTKQINQVTQDILKYSLIPLPPLNEQIRIAKTVKKYFDLVDIIANNI